MKLFISLSLSYLIIVSRFRRVSGDTYAECENLSSGAFIGGTKGCQSYIYCDGEDSYEGFCPSQLLFNTKDGSCAPAGDVDCSDNKSPSTTTTTTTTTKPTTTTSTTTKTTTTTHITTPTKEPTTIAAAVGTTNNDIELAEEVTMPTEPQVFTDAQTTPSAIITTVLINGGGSTSKPAQTCPATDKLDEVIFLPSDISCSEYFVCYHGTPVTMYCSGQLYFDYLTSKCELPERVNCKIGNLVTPNPKKECTANTFDYFPYPKNCNYFYKCINGFLSLQQCPIGFGWSEEMKLCLKLHQGRCPIKAAEQEQSQAWLNNVFSL